MTFNFLGPGLTVNVEAKVKEQIILDSSDIETKKADPVKAHFSSATVMHKCNAYDQGE